jgi:chromosome segregation ATPase
MEQMGFAGSVILHQGDHELDFKNYGLQILVKFRNKDSLQPLSSSVQSGGEKSVTTALYIMALQVNV